MLLYALDQEGFPISSFLANRGKNYRCPDCGNYVRLRYGEKVRPHFYHFIEGHCEGEGKSLRHQKIQEFLASLFHLPKEAMEKKFIEIDRRADLALESKKWVFEIQCSPLSKEEAMARKEDYKKLGYKVIWLLDDKLFNRPRPTPLEEFCEKEPFYYIDFTTTPILYEQRPIIDRGRILWKSNKRLIDLSQTSEKERYIHEDVRTLYSYIDEIYPYHAGSLFDREQLAFQESYSLKIALKKINKRESAASRGWIWKKANEIIAHFCAD